VIDQDPDVSSEIGLWNRLGNEVLRGHTTLMVIDGDGACPYPRSGL